MRSLAFVEGVGDVFGQVTCPLVERVGACEKVIPQVNVVTVELPQGFTLTFTVLVTVCVDVAAVPVTVCLLVIVLVVKVVPDVR